MAIQDEIWEIVKKLNAAWLESNWEILELYFDENVVMTLPGFQQEIIGKDPLIQSYKDFVSNAEISQFQESNPVFHAWEKIVMVTYDFEIIYSENEKDAHEFGKETFFFSQKKGKWTIIWRSMAFIPSDQTK